MLSVFTDAFHSFDGGGHGVFGYNETVCAGSRQCTILRSMVGTLSQPGALHLNICEKTLKGWFLRYTASNSGFDPCVLEGCYV